MARHYVTIGIDHGTTNSCIAVLDGDRPRVIKSFAGAEITPSAVFIDNRGRRFVGRAAVEAMMATDLKNGSGHTGYKLGIGQDGRYEFAAARQVLRAPELGGIVLGELLRCYREESGEQPRAAVITVPAKFEHNACEGTREAARLAGLSFYPQIQEPIAAALAYGFATADSRAQWMVFDLGGGTLDVSLIIARQGKLIVPEEGHAGDTRLGGRKFDREILTHVLGELGKRYALSGFAEENSTYRGAWNCLLLACEAAKIRLSQKPETVVEVDGILCQDERGTPVKVEVPITRSQYQKLIAADVERAIHACQQLLAKNRLTAREVARLILVGGPTQTPYIRQILADRLGIELDTSIDPMTAVAIGAAMHAATVELPAELVKEKAADSTAGAPELEVQLEYERVSNQTTHNVTGRVTGPAAAAGGLSYTIRRDDGLWASPPQPIAETGIFSCDVQLIESDRPKLSHFTTSVQDLSGRVLVEVKEPAIWFKLPSASARLANSLLVAVQGNAIATLVKQGAELPARGSNKETFKTAKALRKGSAEDVLRIPILEGVTHLLGGEAPLADGHVHVGTLIIAGSDDRVTRDLPAGAEVKVTIEQDESREIRATAYIPLLEEDFEANVRSEGYELDQKQLLERFAALKSDLAEVEGLQATHPLPEVADALALFQRLAVAAEIDKDLERAQKGERDALYRVYRRILELAGALGHLAECQRRPRLEKLVQSLTALAGEAEKEELDALRSRLAAAGDDPQALQAVADDLHNLDLKLRQRPYYDLLVDLIALSGRRVTLYQHELFEQAGQLLDRIDARGGAEALTEADCRELTAQHDKLARAHSDLYQLREQALAKLPPGKSPAEISDLIKAQTGRSS